MFSYNPDSKEIIYGCYYNIIFIMTNITILLFFHNNLDTIMLLQYYNIIIWPRIFLYNNITRMMLLLHNLFYVIILL